MSCRAPVEFFRSRYAIIGAVLEADFDAVFYTVDIHGFRKPPEQIRAVMYQGLVNSVDALKRSSPHTRLFHLSQLDP